MYMVALIAGSRFFKSFISFSSFWFPIPNLLLNLFRAKKINKNCDWLINICFDGRTPTVPGVRSVDRRSRARSPSLSIHLSRWPNRNPMRRPIHTSRPPRSHSVRRMMMMTARLRWVQCVKYSTDLLLTYLFTYAFSHLFIDLFIFIVTCFFYIYLCTYSFSCIFIYLFIYLLIYLFIYLFILFL